MYATQHRGNFQKAGLTERDVMNRAVKYVATVNNVQEIALFGTSDLLYWQQKLASEGLRPVDCGGSAEVAIHGISGRWMGIPFRELTVGITVHATQSSDVPSIWLEHAFSSSKTLAFLERTLFHTPYRHAIVEVEREPFPEISVGKSDSDILHLRMKPRERDDDIENDVWEGAIYLPGRGRTRRRRIFFARLSGDTNVYSFRPKDDNMEIAATQNGLRSLMDSRFVPLQWRIRKNSKHARSKTY